MLLFKKSLINGYCNRLYDLGKKHGPFLYYGRVKAHSAGKNRNATSINTKTGPPNCQISLP